MSRTEERVRAQRMDALDKGNAVRTANAALKRSIKAHNSRTRSWTAAANVIESPPDYLRNMRLRPFLKACRWLGDSKIDSIFRICGVGESFSVGSLTARQREAVVDLLRGGKISERPRVSEFQHTEDVVRSGQAW